MPRINYKRYEIFKNTDNTIDQLPFVPLPVNVGDKYEKWNTNTSRLDKFAQSYYDNPFFDFLILLANPKYLSEFDIPDGAVIRIPFPIDKAKADYENGLKLIRKG
jgi:hypothetical protein